jgi:ABC-type polysaccharide/polyol phosphate export permease
MTELVVVEFKVRYARRSLSFLWWFLEPLLLALTFFFLTLVLSGSGMRSAVSFSEIFMRVVFWQWFRNSINLGMTSMASSASIIKQVRFPAVLLLASRLMIEFANCLISVLLVLGVLALAGVSPSMAWLELPVPIAAQLVLIVALSLWLSVLAVFVQDTVPIVNFALNLAMYVSPVAFRVERVPERLRGVLDFNPFTAYMDAFNSTLIDGAGVRNWSDLALWSALFAVVGVAGFFVFQRTKKKFYRFL